MTTSIGNGSCSHQLKSTLPRWVGLTESMALMVTAPKNLKAGPRSNRTSDISADRSKTDKRPVVEQRWRPILACGWMDAMDVVIDDRRRR